MSKNIDFTTGPIKKNIIRFAFPIFLGNLFQHLYSATDSLIVGNFLGPQALASVSSSGPLTFVLIGFFNGVATGAGIVISKYFGAKNFEKLHRAIHTDIAFGLTAAVALSIICSIFSPTLLNMMKTPEDILLTSIEYFRVFSYGLFFTLMYNILMGIMNAIGDSKHPLYYLVFSSIVNVILDLVFIGVFKWGVASAAFATLIAQGISCILCLNKMFKGNDVYKLNFKDIKFDKPIIKEIVNFGVPSGFQNSVIGIANAFVQTNINTFSSIAVAGSGVYGKIESFVFLPIMSISVALATCVGQNLGARDIKRAKDSAKFGLFCSVITAELIGVIVFFTMPFFASLFNDDPRVIAHAASQAKVQGFFFCFLALSHTIAGVLRGAGKAKVPMIIMFIVWCILRVSFISVMIHFINDVKVVFAAYPVTWTISSIIFLIYYFKVDWANGFKN